MTHALIAEARRLDAEARRHKREANRHRQAARAARERQTAVETECRRLGIAVSYETDNQREGAIHGGQRPHSRP